MSTRLRNAQGRFVKDRPSLANNRAQVPGGLGTTLDAPITVAGIEWTPSDARPDACPIGVALAVEAIARALTATPTEETLDA